MFNKLIASAPGPRSWLRNPTVMFVSVGVHLVALGGILWASTKPPAEPEPEPERITYIDITEVPPPPDLDEVYEAPTEPTEPAPAQQTSAPAPRTSAPTPAPPQRAPAAPRNPTPSPAATDQPAGFQELDIPNVEVTGIPRPDLAAAPVRAEDFGGRGAAGGSASGTPAPAPPLPAGRGRGAGTGTGGGTGSGTGSGTGTTYSANLVDEQAEMVNRGDISRILSRRYPANLRDAGIEGRVVVQFIVDQNGRVEAGSVKVISSTQEGFVEATRTAVGDFRFRPAKKQGQNVRQVVQVPVTWQLTQR